MKGIGICVREVPVLRGRVWNRPTFMRSANMVYVPNMELAFIAPTGLLMNSQTRNLLDHKLVALEVVDRLVSALLA